MELFECERLFARITRVACDRNRKAGLIFACDGCPGLGAGFVINTEEFMAKYGVCRKCGKKDVTLPAGGLCYCCYRDERAAAGRPIPGTGNPAAPKKPRGKPAVRAKAVAAVCPPPPSTSVSDVVVADMAAEIEALFVAKKAEWLEDLRGATSVRSRARVFLAMADALEGLGY